MQTEENKSDVAKREEETLKFWRDNQIFEKTLAKKSSKGEFVFYDGPPFATGLPHHGSLLPSIVKDLIPRYKTMRGYHVRRRWGWDTHGLPIENMIEKDLGLKSKKDIETLGIEKFNEACRAKVLQYAHDWEKYVDRVGRFVEFKNAYKTLDPTYMESVWWTLKSIHEKGLLYEGRKVLLYCPRCETPLAKAEIAMDDSYKDVAEEAVTVEFRIKGEKDTSLLAWTTTPWTLPGNVALAVHPDVTYVTIEKKDMGVGKLVRFILAKERLEANFGSDDYKIIKEQKGKNLVGLEYEPLYELDAVIRQLADSGKKAWFVTEADFVTTEDGTGIVHTAVMYGEDDYNLGLKIDLPMIPLLLPNGHYNDDAPEFIRGEYIKKAEKLIKADLENRGLLFERKMYEHSYPHCHRCATPLIYNALSSWFINIQKNKKLMLQLNQKINWVPSHLKNGRFGNILENAPDWTISRNRFWATPLPIWKCDSCKKTKIVGSIEDLKKDAKKSGNNFILMRHGHYQNNTTGKISSDPDLDSNHQISDRGKEEVTKTAKTLAKQKIDLIFTSDFDRTRETADLVASLINIPKENVISDVRLREIKTGEFEGKTWKEYHDLFKTSEERYLKKPKGGESILELKQRLGDFIFEVDTKYKNKNILVVSHALSLYLLECIAEGRDMHAVMRQDTEEEKFDTGEARELDFWQYPHNGEYELDLHRPYIDSMFLVCECGGQMERIKEVVDCWVESGSMPFAEHHYPFENKKEFEKNSPGDYVAEYIGQTRTWFYYMLAISATLFGKEPFRNVVVTGNLLAADGSKISKSKGNYTDPLILIDRFGADAYRFYQMTCVVMQAEDTLFKDDEVKEVYQRVVNILWNTLQFYIMYVPKDPVNVKPEKSPYVLDQYILSRLYELRNEVTENLDAFNTIKAGKPIRDFISDLSTWYVRRSRDRFSARGGRGSVEDGQYAVATLRFVFLELSKIIAPFMPFMADEMYKAMSGPLESVHLESWPEAGKIHKDVIEKTKVVRDIVSVALELRSKANIKVRQPLSKLAITEKLDEEYLQLIKDEVNVKEVTFGSEILLDTEVTESLKKEGDYRDFVRMVQDLRKTQNLQPKDLVTISIPPEFKEVVKIFETEFMKTVGAKEIRYEGTAVVIKS